MAWSLSTRKAVDVRIDDADRRTFRRQRQREVHRRRALADAALAGGDGDDVLDTRQQLHAALRRVRDDLAGDADADVGDTLDRAGGGDQRAAQAVDLAGGGIAQFHVERDIAAGHAQVLQLAGGHEVAAGVGVDDSLEGLLDRCVGDVGHDEVSEKQPAV
jgi:hypothetical protein